jgi:agmatine/peptidylarginine deiminase
MRFPRPFPLVRPLVAGLLLLLAAAPAAVAEGDRAPERRLLIPKAFVTADELANPDLYRPRQDNVFMPAPSTLPPPPAGVLRPGEFEPMDSVVISVLSYGSDFMAMWWQMVDVYRNAGHTWIIADPSAKQQLEPLLYGAGIEESAYSWLNYPLDSIWVRDYGPEFAVEPDGTRHVVDAYYWGRPLDDLVPLWIAASDWIGADGQPLEAHSHIHEMSGGNVMSDGAGTCFFSDIVYGYEKPVGWSDQDVDDLMREYLGCEQMVVLNPICLDGTGHIDLYAKLLSPTSILLGEFSPETHFKGETYVADPWNCTDNYIDDYQDQEDNLAIIEATTNLEGEAWQVTRLPMLEPYKSGPDWVYRSYMNSQIFNNWVAMPSYYAPKGDETADDLLEMEAQAIAAYEAALPGVNVVPIDADHIIPMAGAMHCITHEIPQEAGGGWEPPATYCGDGVIQGDLGETCDGKVFGGETCQTQGFDSGNLACDMDCLIDTSDCESGSDADTDADSDTDTDTDADGGPDDGGDDDGCGCGAAGATGGASPVLAILAFLLFG